MAPPLSDSADRRGRRFKAPRPMRTIILSLVLLHTGRRGSGAGFIQGLGSQRSRRRQRRPPAFATLLNDQGFRIQDEKGQTLADIWLRKAIPGSEKPSGPKGAVLFPFLADGELIGLLQFASRGA